MKSKLISQGCEAGARLFKWNRISWSGVGDMSIPRCLCYPKKTLDTS